MAGQLKTVGEIFQETWALYQRRALSILAVISLTTFVLVATIVAVLCIARLWAGDFASIPEQLLSVQPSWLPLAIGLPVLLILTALFSWSQAAVIVVSVDENCSVKDALRDGLYYCFPLALIAMLYLGIVVTGFTLLLIPGLIVMLSMSLGFYVMVDEGVTGMDALVTSRRYVYGHWWNVFGKLLLVWLVSLVMSCIPVIGQLLSFVFAPFLMLFMVVVYRDLKNHCLGHMLPDRKSLWFVMAAVGIVLPFLGVVGAMVTLGPQVPELLKQLQSGTFAGFQIPGTGHTDLEKDSSVPAVPSVRRLVSVDGSWSWNDPIGDVDNPSLDIGRVSLTSGNEELLITVTMARNVSSFFTVDSNGEVSSLIYLYIDVDVNRQTGSQVLGSVSRMGYDKQINVVLEPQPYGAGQVHVGVLSLDGNSQQSLGKIEDNAVQLADNSLRFRVPYSLLQVKKGQTVRLCFREAAQEQSSGLAKDKLVTLQ